MNIIDISKLQGQSYNIESVADDCPYKDKFNKRKK